MNVCFHIILIMNQFLENFSINSNSKYDWSRTINDYVELLRSRVEFQKFHFNGSFSLSSIPNQNVHYYGLNIDIKTHQKVGSLCGKSSFVNRSVNCLETPQVYLAKLSTSNTSISFVNNTFLLLMHICWD